MGVQPFSTRSLIRIALAIYVLLYLPRLGHASTWSQSTSPHFSLYSEGRSNQDHRTLVLLERSRNLFLSLGILNTAWEHPVTIFAFKDGENFGHYAPPGSVGFFQRGQAADYIGLLDQNSDLVLHEYAHAAIATVWPSLPVWINEGLAGYYSTAKWGRDRVSVGGDLWGLPGAFDSLSPRMLSSILFAPNALIDSDARASSRRYMLSWAVVDMMMTEPRYACKFRTFLDTLSSGTPLTEALQSTYGLKLVQLETDLGEHLQRGPSATATYPYNGNRDNADRDEEGIAVKYSDKGEFKVEIGLADLLSYNPLATATARVRLEQLVVQYPESPEPEERLAALAWRTDDDAGVQLHMDNAYRIGSRNVELLILDAQLAQRTGKPQSRLIPLLERALAEQPNNYRARMLLGYFACQSKDFLRALSLLKPITNVDDPDAFVVLGSLAYSAAGAKDYSSASVYTSAALKRARSDADRAAMGHLLTWLAARIASSTEPRSTITTLSASSRPF